ncbi:ATP phosphoribosyltransferase regulatory subunit [Clostridium estertheticum]|uniref:ATP phosphoribosyltransferase regulatory subunit n=1 Tax=Clostridium estertheticum TaxID=238834 RepID=UPI001C6E0387|nr:ATP phosphoribosyltransferase regulatory subunit [Clostridium estertheticum]MBW9152583.1 ATP phosphoribosyltransferase regulatory subunit [Clostridium estertheticum]WLC85949.1 ATP phosphoribosyltransferase regulatory subunit [Clostridium estertheticum]
MNNWKKHIPEGSRDILFEDCSNKIKIIDTLRNLYISTGYLEVISPTLEFYDVFQGDDVSIEQEKMYKLFDNAGRILVLRPDMTMPIARIVATKLRDSAYPLRICYSGNIFRINENWNGKVSEMTQSGIEIIGSESPKSDAEVIITAISSLLAIGVKKFELEIGQAEFFKGLIEDIDLDHEEMERLRGLVENKNFGALREFIDDKELTLGIENVEALKKLPELFGGIEILGTARMLTQNRRALAALDTIEKIYERIVSVGFGEYISIDLGMVQHIDYYTGITFRGYSSEVGTTIISGGRYDNLISKFGASMPAVGFAIDVDNIQSVLSKQGNDNEKVNEKFMIYFENDLVACAYKFAEQIRAKGLSTELSLFEEKEKTLNYAQIKGIDKMICLLEGNKIELIDTKSKKSFKTSTEKFINGLDMYINILGE